MTPEQLNRHGPLPLYYQLARIIRARINNGEYQVGNLLPSENKLAQEFSVSRQVVRQALKELVIEGRVSARQGVGYAINPPRIRKSLPRLGSHTASMASLGQRTQTLILRKEIITPPDFVAERLLSPDEDQCAIIERVSYLEDEPVCLITAYYPLNCAKVLLQRDLNNQSIYAILRRECNLIPSRAETAISVVFADERMSSVLQIREGAPLLNIASFSWSQKQELFEYSSGLYRSDRFELTLEQV